MKRLLTCVVCLLLAACSSQSSSTETPSGAAPAAAPAAPLAPKEIPAGPKLFVSNESGGDLSVIDVATRQLVATIPVGKRPRGVRLAPDGSFIYVALSGSPIAGPGVDESKLPPPDKSADGIGVVSVKDLKLVRTIPAGSDPEQLAVTADGKRLFIANEDVSAATAIDVETGMVLGSFKVGEEPEGVNIRPDGRVVYVTSEGDNQVSVIDAVNLKLLKTLEVGARPRYRLPAGQFARLCALRDRAGDYRHRCEGAPRAQHDQARRRPVGSPHGHRRLSRRQASLRYDRAWQERAVHRHQDQQDGRAGRGRRTAVGHCRVTEREDDFHRQRPVQ